MKRILLSAITLLFLTAIAKADGLIVADVGIQPGKTATVQVSLSSTGETYRAVLFSLTLPTGIIITKDEYGEPVTTADEHLAAAGYSVTANHLDDSSDRFAVMNTGGNTVIPAECGPLFTFTIEADAGLTPGDVLTGTLSGIKLTDAYAEDHQADDVTFSITVEEARTILDETSTTAPESATGVDVRVKRTIKANEWSTICLPFAMTARQVTDAFGDDVQLGDFTGTEPEFDDADNVIGIKVNFSTVTAIEANHPYIIKVSAPIAEFALDGVDIVTNEDEAYIEFDNGKTGSRRVVYCGFYGTYHANTVLDKFTLFLNDNKFWYSTGNTKMKAFRAYFEFLDILTEVEDAYNSRIAMTFSDGTTTDIHGITNDELRMTNDVYDLQGRRVNASLMNSEKRIVNSGSLKKGLYIVNGKKVVKK